MAQYDLNLRDYWRILRKRKWSTLFITLAFGGLAFLFAQVQTPDPIFQAMAVVKYERATTFVGLLVETISLSSGDNITTQAAVVRSFSVLERAAKHLGRIPAGLDSEQIRQNPRHILTLSELRSQVATIPEENTTLINITVTHPDRTQATRIANAVAQAYQEENSLIRNQKIREARRFIEQQLREVEGRLQQAEDGIRNLKERRGFVALTEETTSSVARLAVLETEYEKVRREQEEVLSQIKALENLQLTSNVVPPRLLSEAGDPAIAKLSSAIVDMSLERENLLVTLTPQHPQIRDIDARIASARESLDSRMRNARDNLIREMRIKGQTLDGRAGELQRQVRRIREEQRGLPDLSRQLAQLQRELTQNENLQSQFRTRLAEVQIKEREQAEEVSVVRPAIEPTRPMNPPQTAAKTLVGILIGLTVGLVLAFVLESLDTSIGTIQDVEGYLEIPVLGLIPNIDPNDPFLVSAEQEEPDSPLAKMRPFLLTLLNPKSTIAEAYRSLRTNIEFLTLEKKTKTLCLTSASLMEGKTTTAINLAISMVQMGKKVLLVEADLRKPFLHHAFGIPRDPGLSEIILGNRDWHECLRTATDLMLGPLGVDRLMASPNIDKLSLLTSGSPPPNPSEFLNSPRMTELVKAFSQDFDFVIFDCPPILPVTDAAILAAKTDGTIIVYRVGKIARSALKRAKALLENVHGQVLGVVLTGLKAEISPDYEELEYYRYAYGHEPGRTSSRSRTASPKRSLWGRVTSLFT
jgi:capsular exopolysaccharide synthesis family protein